MVNKFGDCNQVQYTTIHMNKEEHLMLYFLNPVKKQDKDLNVYLTPLIDDLQELWRGLVVIDAIKLRRHRFFKLHDIQIWAIFDYYIWVL